MNVPLPPVSLWEQFSVIGILVLVMILLGLGARYAFREFTKWQAEQDTKRECEHEKQRAWEASQEAKIEQDRRERDLSWQKFFERINGENGQAIGKLTDVNQMLVQQMNQVLTQMQALTSKIQDHDAFTRSALDNGQQKGKGE